jgi:hypothetical protein
MIKNRRKHRNSWQPMRWTNMPLKGHNFPYVGECRRGGWWRCWNFWIFVVPICVIIKFLPSSQYVLQHVLNSTSLYPISFALNCTLCTLCNQLKRRRLQYIYYNISIMGPCKAWFIYFFGDEPINGAHHKRKRKKKKNLNFRCYCPKEKMTPMAFHLGWKFPNLQKAWISPKYYYQWGFFFLNIFNIFKKFKFLYEFCDIKNLAFFPDKILKIGQIYT